MYDGILQTIVEMAKSKKRKIVLPESNDKRILEAATIIQENNIADIVLIGNKEEILDNIAKFNINNFSNNISIIDPNNYIKKEEYINTLYELRKQKV